MLRDDLGLTGTKIACGEGACGACAVLVDGRAVASCLLPVAAVEGHAVVTIEGISRHGPTAVQESFVAEDALQCGFCTPGQIVTATALLQPLSLRRVPEDRASNPPRRWEYVVTLRLVRSESEMEGRVTEVWTLVDEEDALEMWPAEEKLRVVGRSAPCLDGSLRAAGRASYTVDVRLPGMLHAGVLRSPVAHARVSGLRLETARAVAGVRAVIGPESSMSFTMPEKLLTSEPMYAGQPIALVAADTPEQAHAALAALAPELEVLPHVLDPLAAVYDQRFAAEPREEGRGDVDAAFRDADVAVEFELETPDHLQTPLEPHAAVAHWDGADLTVWLSTQGMFDARRELARAFELTENRVRVISEFIGGGFGSKQGAGFEAIAAAELARVTGRPVRLVNDRHAEQLDGGRRARTWQTLRLGARRDGTLVAIEVEAVIDQGQAGMGLIGPVLAPALSLYACPNVRAMGFPAKTNRRGQNAFRAPGMVEGISAFEQAMDELAFTLEIDPLELRRRNHVDRDQESGLPYSCKRLLACYERAAELAGWDARERLRDPQPDGLRRGMGCASQIWWGSGGPPAHASVRIDAAAHARVLTGIQDIGTGTLTAARLVAAEELGLPLDHIRVVGGDTAPNLYGPVAGGSMTVPSVIPAVRAAAAKARLRLLQLASDVLEIAAEYLELRDGRLWSRDRALNLPVTEVTEKLGNATIDASGSRGPNPSDVKVQTFGCQIAQVAVDPHLGEIRVERIVAVHDVGRIVNPLGASSQVEGGVLQGMAYALFEELVLDPTMGVPVNAHLDDYKLPGVGARGLGEPPIIPTAAAIANAFRARHRPALPRAADEPPSRPRGARVIAYARPSSLEEALRLLETDGAVAMGGATDLAGQLDRRLRAASLLVDLQAADLSGIKANGGGVTIGSTTTLADLGTSPLIAPYAAVARAAGEAASPLLRNVGTVAGNLCQHTRCWYYRGEEWHCWLGGGDTCYAQIGDHRKPNLEPGECISAHPSDHAPALAACGATVRVASLGGERELPLLDLYRRPTADNRSLLTLAPCELVIEVRLPTAPSASVYVRAGERQAFSFPLVSVAAACRGDTVRLVAAGVANVPRELDPADPLAGLPGNPRSAWKRKVFEALAERGLAQIAQAEAGPS